MLLSCGSRERAEAEGQETIVCWLISKQVAVHKSYRSESLAQLRATIPAWTLELTWAPALNYRGLG